MNPKKLQIIFFLLLSIIDIRVRATNIEIPKNCLKTSDACAFLNETKLIKIDNELVTLRMPSGASFERLTQAHYKMIRGVFHVKATRHVVLQTLYGELALSSGEALIEVQDALVKFTNLSSDLKYTPRGDERSYELPQGFASYFTRVTKAGVAEVGFPHPAEIESLIKVWSQAYSKSEKPIFAASLKNFMTSWRGATSVVGPWYLDTVHREIAAEEAEEARLARLKAEQDKENSRYRQLFRERNFMQF